MRSWGEMGTRNQGAAQEIANLAGYFPGD
ncbi:unnamed protein product [Linum tenue]|uniref:Uncharacterized protein n=1 Tax=Linum tenue TaxID=586396 RepID=A0AAV0PZT3_9ROSI|nr:unnamed protein product [Linum tenue]